MSSQEPAPDMLSMPRESQSRSSDSLASSASAASSTATSAAASSEGLIRSQVPSRPPTRRHPATPATPPSLLKSMLLVVVLMLFMDLLELLQKQMLQHLLRPLASSSSSPLSTSNSLNPLRRWFRNAGENEDFLVSMDLFVSSPPFATMSFQDEQDDSMATSPSSSSRADDECYRLFVDTSSHQEICVITI